MTDAERVRELIGETIPEGSSDLDTLFTDAQILTWLGDADGDVDAAVLRGWRAKAAIYVELVDTAEGTSKRAMSDLHKNALSMVEALSSGSSSGGTSGRTRIRKLTRS